MTTATRDDPNKVGVPDDGPLFLARQRRAGA